MQVLKFLFISTVLTIISTVDLIEQQCDLSSFSHDPTIVSTTYGPIRGSCNQVSISDPDKPNRTEHILKWLGIPYAEPPIGPNRFMRPKQTKPWKNMIQTTEFSKICIQAGFKPMSEDCLYLNVYVPLKSINNRPLPIYVFIHGGAFVRGYGSSINAEYAVGISDIIFVTFNYRLGPFGFAYLNETNITGNMGFLDQHMALKWVYENAINFNGDRDRITLGGQSAGSFSIGYHEIYRPSWPYFKNIVHQSGSIFTPKRVFVSPSEATRRTSDVFDLLGCDRSLSASERLNCIQNGDKINSKQVLTVSEAYEEEKILNNKSLACSINPLFPLVQNNIQFSESVKEAFLNENFKKNTSIINGYNHDEGMLLNNF